MGVRRAFVHRKRYEEFLNTLRPLAANQRQEPLVMFGQAEQAERLVRDALANGAELLTGDPPSAADDPPRFPPTVVVNARAEMAMCQEASFAPLLAVMCAVLLWGTSLPGVDLSRMGDLGLVTVLPPAMYAAFVLLTVSFCLAVQRHQTPVGVLLLHVIVLIVMIHGTPAILEGTLRYAWAWKHVAIVDYIQRHGSG